VRELVAENYVSTTPHKLLNPYVPEAL
jgi:hypothetical protein